MLLALSDVTYVFIGRFKFLLLKFLYEYGPMSLCGLIHDLTSHLWEWYYEFNGHNTCRLLRMTILLVFLQNFLTKCEKYFDWILKYWFGLSRKSIKLFVLQNFLNNTFILADCPGQRTDLHSLPPAVLSLLSCVGVGGNSACLRANVSATSRGKIRVASAEICIQRIDNRIIID